MIKEKRLKKIVIKKKRLKKIVIIEKDCDKKGCDKKRLQKTFMLSNRMNSVVM